MITVLGVDIGTTGLKMAAFTRVEDDAELTQIGEYTQSYELSSHTNDLFGDIDPGKWIDAFREGCTALSGTLPDVDAVALSGTTPGLTAMADDGSALYPSILMLDQRSRSQAKSIIDAVGAERLLAETGNMPVAGGCSLASILWLRDNEPDIYRRTACFGHSNTFAGKWLTGNFAIDPSSASLMALYNTGANDLSWNTDVADAVGFSVDRLPSLMWAHQSPGRVKPALAKELGLTKEPAVIIGGNDAVLAAYSAGIREPGDVINVNGTCEITLVCLPRCLASAHYNVRAHVVPHRWLTLHVMNAGGIAYEWFRTIFCRDMSEAEFYRDFVPHSIETWLRKESPVRYVPYLMGSRYSLEPLKAEFTGLSRVTDRDEMLAAMVMSLCCYQKEHLDAVALDVRLSNTIHLTGGANMPSVAEAKKQWMRPCEYAFREQSSVRGAALMACKYLDDE
jgi:xylulokinase